MKREWRLLEIAGIATVLLYLVTLALVGGGTPGEIVSNTANWVIFQSGQVWNEINYSTSYAPLMLVQKAPIPLLQFVPSETVDKIKGVKTGTRGFHQDVPAEDVVIETVLGPLPQGRQDLGRHQVVVEQDVRGADRRERLAGQQARIARAGADKEHLPDRLRGGGRL